MGTRSKRCLSMHISVTLRQPYRYKGVTAMREGILTEREWRKKAMRATSGPPRCWGAQCMIQKKTAPDMRKRQLCYVVGTLVVICAGVAGIVWARLSTPPAEYPILPALSEAVTAGSEKPGVRANSAVSYTLTHGMQLQEVTLTRDQLLRGKMMLIDSEHPLPADTPGANTVCIATHGKGIVPVRDLTLKSGQQTISALYDLFYDLRQKGVEGLVVWRGTLSEAEQREWQLERVRLHSASMSLAEAVERARREVDDPRMSDYQQQYTVDIRLNATWNGAVDERAPARTEQGRYLLQNAWRYGFIQRFPSAGDDPLRAHCFRYVGKAHSIAMTYLDLDLKAYLQHLHEKQVIVIERNEKPKYVILCKPVTDGYVNMKVPQGGTYEASYDNMGYAVVACTLPD